MTTLTQGQWEDALLAADIDPWMNAVETEGAYIDLEYSGRGMYGSNCPAIVGAPEHGTLFLIQLALILHSCDDDEPSTEQIALELAKNMQTDRMGDAHVMYFPGLEITQ